MQWPLRLRLFAHVSWSIADVVGRESIADVVGRESITDIAGLGSIAGAGEFSSPVPQVAIYLLTMRAVPMPPPMQSVASPCLESLLAIS